MWNFTKIHPAAVALFHVAGRTDVATRLANAPTMWREDKQQIELLPESQNPEYKLTTCWFRSKVWTSSPSSPPHPPPHPITTALNLIKWPYFPRSPTSELRCISVNCWSSYRLLLTAFSCIYSSKFLNFTDPVQYEWLCNTLQVLLQMGLKLGISYCNSSTD
jgi:hypothetical protein